MYILLYFVRYVKRVFAVYIPWEGFHMTSYNNFESQNGWIMPGTGRQLLFGPEDYYVDENGDIWVPCWGCACAGGTGKAQAHIMEGNNPQGG